MTADPKLQGGSSTDLHPSSWRLTALGISVALGMLALGGLALLETRSDTWAQASQSARNLLLALDRDIGRNVTILDLSLQGLIEALAEPDIGQASPRIRHHALFDRSSDAEDLGIVAVLDTEGNVVEDSTSIEPQRLNLAERDFFKIHRDHPDVGLFVSRPFRSRAASGDLWFSISRRLSSPDADFQGVVEGALRLEYFKRLFERLELGSQGSITLFRSDGRVLMRYPFSETDIDRDMSRNDTFRHFATMQSGQYVARSTIDGVERLYTFRRVGDLPLILSVNLATSQIYAPWRLKALVIGPVLALLSAAAVASCLLFRREVLRRARVEQSLAVAADKLSVMAATDGLTGLVNRRAFETEFDRAFRRAVRQGTPLAVIMLDADFFKRYNDTYGHLAGDEVLRAVAACIGRSLQRPDDVAARYGGEEFVALLSDTDMIAAADVADRIRAAVEDLGIIHAGSAIGSVTVSVGVATASPFIGDDPTQLIEAADTALYAAKRDGRNCVRTVEAHFSAAMQHAAGPIMLRSPTASAPA